MYNIAISNTAKNEVKTFSKDIREKVVSILERVRINPQRYLKKVVGDSCYKIRFDSYKIFLDIENSSILILTVKRSDYKDV